jgi:ubiquinone/menaquinone biosynthesis C-methylase UbiE
MKHEIDYKEKAESYVVLKKKAQRLWKKYGGGKTLDIGCGKGIFGAEVGAVLFDVKNFTTNGLSVVEGSAEQLPFLSASFDTVTMWNVLEHLENPWQAVREVARVLRPAGTFLFSVPNVYRLKNCLSFLFTGDMKRYNNTNDHKFIYTKHLIHMLLSAFTITAQGFTQGGKTKWTGETYWIAARKKS